MKRKHFSGILFLFALAFVGCQSDEELVEPVPQADSTARVAATAVAPKWTGGYPSVKYGAVSVDLYLKTDVNSKVYWIISNKELSLVSDVLKAQAIKPTLTSIKFHGTSTLTAAKEKVEKLVKFTPGTKYYSYLVAESTTGLILQTTVKPLLFTMHPLQEIKEYRSNAENRQVLYLIYRPEEILKDPAKKSPICFFLGGNGEVAAQGKINLIRNGGLPDYINKGNAVPMIVVSIQHIKTNWNVNMIEEGVTHALATYAVDTKKVYMTGMSGGGFATWNYSTAFPAKLTAIVPISGGGSKAKACSLKNIPVYAFHNQTDSTVPSSNSVNMVNAVNACPPVEKAKLTLFPDSGHNCWRRVYNINHSEWSKSPNVPKVDIYAWMLSKSK